MAVFKNSVSLGDERSDLVRSLIFPVLFVLLLWCIELIERGTYQDLYRYGIFPRSLMGSRGIIFSPLIHGNFSHLINNSIPLIVLGWCLFYFYKEVAYKVFFLIWVVGNFWLWIMARPSYHIGASGIIYGLTSFLFFSGLIRRNRQLIVVSLLVTFLYGSLVWGIFPIDYKVSFEGHFTGALSGLMFALYFRKVGIQKEQVLWEEKEIIPEESLKDDNQSKTAAVKLVYHFKAELPPKELK